MFLGTSPSTHRLNLFLILPIAGSAAVLGCGGPTDYDAKPVLDDLVNRVILPTQSAWVESAADLQEKTTALAQDPTESTLVAAQESWRSARTSWRNGDAFAFGPIETENLGAQIDWWPAKPELIEQNLTTSSTINAEYIHSLGTSSKGFLALEYFLFDPAQENASIALALTGDAAESRRVYITALGEDLASQVVALHDAWSPENGNYAADLTLAGEGDSSFISQKSAVDELVNQMVFETDALLNTRIGKPAGLTNGGEPLPDTEETPRSDNSLADMLSSLAGIQNIYNGTYGGADGKGISDLVRARSVSTDDAVQEAFADATAKIQAIPPPFRTAVTSHPTEVESAYQAVRTLKRALATEVVGVLGSTLRFNDADGD